MANVKIDELMSGGDGRLITLTPHQTVAHARELMDQHGIQALPVLRDGEPAGIVTARDLVGDLNENTPVSELMTTKLYTVPRYEDPSIAARIMRNHTLHHVLVTHEGQLCGIVSSYDLLKLVENHRFVMKNPPTPSKRKGGKRHKQEAALAEDREED